MTAPVEELDPRAHPSARGYTFVCLGSLLVIVLVLGQRDLGWLALLPLLTGSIAVAACWSVGPPLVLLCVAGGLVVPLRIRLAIGSGSLVGDLLLAGALLAYCAGQYRLQALVRHIFPPDPRRRRRLPRGRPLVMPVLPAEQARSPELVGPNELMQLLLALMAVTGLAAMAWVLLTASRPPLDFDPWEWQVVAVGWAGCLVATLTWVWTSYRRWKGAGPEASLLYLQDQLWRQTRREQSRLNRWLAWYRLRRQRRHSRTEGS